jgi:ABC-type phosphate transport system substrate-binding protein
VTRPGRSRDAGIAARGWLWRRPVRVALVALVTALSVFLPRAMASAGSYETVDGAGSSWAYIAISQWINDVQPQGLTVNYNPDGSAEGRQNYIQGGEVDFGGSDPPFRNGEDKLAGTGAEKPQYGYSYVPDTGGGTAFMYHLTVGGHLVRNLRLSPLVLMEIFTGTITNWDDSRITKIYGAQLPSEPITPVLRSDGSGASYFFTQWIEDLYPKQWDAFCQKVHPGITLPCGNTEFYPQFGDAKMENGSNNEADYITASYGEGSIGYDEYAYALNSGYPVVQVLNPDGYFVGPTASNVAVALHHAIINENRSSPDFLQQDLAPLYTNKDPRNYPVSSYSYLIVPRSNTSLPPFFNTGAGTSLSAFINYFLCAGQKQMPDLGYSPLPYNLVTGGFQQVNEIPGHVSTPAAGHYQSCGNPTFVNGQDKLLATAPFPTACQKLGAPLNCKVVNGKAVPAGGSSSGGSTTGPSSGGKSSSTGPVNPATGGGATGTGPTTGAANVTGTVVNLGSNGTDRALLAVITALAVIMAVATPPAVGSWLRRRKKQAGA